MKKVSEDMKRATGVYQRPGTNIWHWGIKAPVDLKHLYAGQWAHRCSLETADLRAANTAAALLRGEWLARFERLRQGAEQSTAIAPVQLTQELIREAAALMHARMLESDETQRMAGLSQADMENQALVLHIESAQLRQAYATGDTWPVENILPTWLRALGLEVSLADPLRPVLARELVKARLKATKAIQERHTGELVDTPPDPSLDALWAAQAPIETVHGGTGPVAPSTPRTLRQVYTRWKAAKVRSSDAVNACDRALSLFEAKFGEPALRTITRAMGDEFRAHLLAQELASKTKHDRMTYVKSLLKYACRDLELIPKNPWEGLDIDYKTENRRSPWTAEQLNAFFGQSLFTRYDLPAGAWKSGGEAAYWVPLLGLFTGARVGELCQLRTTDIETTDSGPFMHISEDADGATLKTAASVRAVPIHSELVRLGFLDYVAAMKAASERALWPALRFRKDKPGAYFSDWFGQYRRACVVPVPDFHSLRHTVRTSMTEAGVSEAVQDRITGHEIQGSTGKRAVKSSCPDRRPVRPDAGSFAWMRRPSSKLRCADD